MTKANALASSKARAIYSLNRNGGNATMGIYGGDGSGNWPIVTVYRGSDVVTDGTNPLVTVKVILEDTNEWIRIVQLSGVSDGDEVYGMTRSGQRYTTAVSIASAPAPGVKRNPWLLQSSPKLIRDENVYAGANRIVPVNIDSRPIASRVRGLAIHVTAGEGNAEQVVKNTWKTTGVAAHFIIERSGAIVQCMALSLTGEAQGGPGDPNPHWLSMEFVCAMNNWGTDGYITGSQIRSCNRLLLDMSKRFSFPPRLASPFIQDEGDYGKLARALAKANGVAGSNTREEAGRSTGLSCHRWLGPGHACPGLVGLRVMPDILNTARIVDDGIDIEL